MKYMGSKSRIKKSIVPILQNIIDKNNIKMYIEPFCLEGNTIVYTKDGIKQIKDLKIGDYVYDEHCELKQVIRISESEKEAIKLKIKGGVDIICSKDHPFYIDENGNEIKSSDSLNIQLQHGDSLRDSLTYVDLTKQITNRRKGIFGSQGGKIVSENKIKLSHVSPEINRYIKVDEDLMFLYGWIVAEGDKGNITLNIKERDVAQAIVEKYLKILGIQNSTNKIMYENTEKNSIQICLPYRTIYEKIFFKELKIGYGARNKNISFLFNVDKALVKVALQSMFQGDGSLTKRGKYRSLNYKTSSKTLAYQLQCLLAVKFGIHSSVHYGINKARKIENRIIKETDYYNLQIRLDKDIEFLTDLKNEYIKINEKPTKYLVKEIVDVGVKKLYDITLENNSTHRYLINGGIITHNCGGANVIDSIKCNTKVGNDISSPLIELWKAIQRGEELPESISRELYNDVRNNQFTEKYPLWFVGVVGFLASYNGRYFDGGYAKEGYENGKLRNYYREAKNNILAQKEYIMDVIFTNKDYRDMKEVKNTLIYADIPYENTKQYNTSKNFDYNCFWNWARKFSENNIVIVSELQAPSDFVCIWEQETLRSIKSKDKSYAVEKLFIHKDNISKIGGLK